MSSGHGHQRPKARGIHHANIRDKEKAIKRLKSSFRRVELGLTLDKDKRQVRSTAVLTEIQPKSTYLFVEEKIPKSSLIVVHLKEPLTIDVRGRVRYCELADRHGGVPKTGEGQLYRMLVEFVFASQSEQEAMEDYFQQVRDENYVATRWHHYVSEKAQSEAKLKVHEMKIAEKVKEVQDQADLATDDMLVGENTKTKISATGAGDVMVGKKKQGDGDDGGQSQAA